MAARGLDLEIFSASLQFKGADDAVYQGLKLKLAAGEWTCLLGASGCGKSTLLRQLAGLIEPGHRDELVIAGGDEADITAQIAWMGQQDLLYPWLNVIDNVCLQQRLVQGRVDADYKARGMELLHSFGLEKNALQRPDSLSGGMRQRVALARTLLQDKPLVLMDEPFSALDAVNRHKLQNLAAEQLAGRTVLLVTHDPQEALRLGQQIVLFRESPARLEVLPSPVGEPPRPVAGLGTYQDQLLQTLGVGA